MRTLILVVEDTFLVAGLGLVMAPDIDHLDSDAKRLTVELRRPDGTRKVAQALVRTPHLRPTNESSVPPRRLLALEGITKDDVPVGTSIFLLGVR